MFHKFKIHRSKVSYRSNKYLLFLNYEDLVLNYKKTLSKLFVFLEVDKSIHKYPKKFFDPELSKKKYCFMEKHQW